MGSWLGRSAQVPGTAPTASIWRRPVHRAIPLSHGQLYVASAVAIAIAIGAFAIAGNRHSGPPRTAITIDGARLGPAFQGIGAISGGGGNSRLLIEYPRVQRQQILDYLFKPGYGADLQILKLEIGGDAYATDGAEPSVEHVKGQVNCHAGYELWLAQQARKLDPAIQIYALQWNTPHWVGAAWSDADIGYLLDWLHCAREYHLTVNYLGGWNEHLPHGITPQVMGWFIKLRAALNAAGYAGVQIVAVDSFAHENGVDVANFIAHHPAFKAAIAVLGYHNLCRYPSTGKTCLVPPAARTSGKPIWESEIGALRQSTGVGAMTRSIDNAYIQVGATGLIEWPLIDSMPAYLPEEDRGLIFADQPWSGQYQVNLMTWVLAQTTQFTSPGWRHIRGASGKLGGPYGSYVSYEAPDRSAWSLVAQTTDAPKVQSITVHVDPGLPRSVVHVWTTNVKSADPSTWMSKRADVHPVHGRFSYKLSPGYIYTFSTSTGQGKGAAVSPAPRPMPLPYVATPDPSGEPRYLGAQDGAFEYAPGAPRSPKSVFEQTARGLPVFWQNPVPTRFPYAVVGYNGWRNYTVSVSVRLSAKGQSAGLISRFDHPRANGVAQKFHGYQFVVGSSGSWKLIANDVLKPERTLATGQLAKPLRAGKWFRLSLSASGTTITARVNGVVVATVHDDEYAAGDAGISTGGWYKVQFRELKVTANPG